MKIKEQKKFQKLREEIPLIVMTNEPNKFKVNILQVIYQAAEVCQLGYMDGMDPDTGEIVPLLVGLQPTDGDQLRVFPLAQILGSFAEHKQYLVPDGQGNYVDYSGNTNKKESGQAVESGATEAS